MLEYLTVNLTNRLHPYFPRSWSGSVAVLKQLTLRPRLTTPLIRINERGIFTDPKGTILPLGKGLLQRLKRFTWVMDGSFMTLLYCNRVILASCYIFQFQMSRNSSASNNCGNRRPVSSSC